jgi:hypothetical protein
MLWLTIPADAQAGVWGVHDQVPAASLIVPFFEVGIDPVANPQNTNFTVYSSKTVTLHWEVWNIDGHGTSNLRGNVQLGIGQTWSANMASIIASEANADERNLLTTGNFYRGFVTIDIVTEETNLTPFDGDYPFDTKNAIQGSIYYLRLSEGSANGLPMVALEYTADPSDVSAFLEGFYQVGDGREEIDLGARLCSAALTQGQTCSSPTDGISAIRARVFRSEPLSGNTRVIVFAWTTSSPAGGGPSVVCTASGLCDSTYSFQQRREDGSIVQSGTNLTLPHVVNVIGTTGSNPGVFNIFNVSNPDNSMQVYAFSFNSASPNGNPNINWDAIFEATIEP